LALVIKSNFMVINHGPGLALLWVEIASDYEMRVSFAGDGTMDPRSEPTVLSEVQPMNEVSIVVRLLTNGRELFDRISGTEYAQVVFRWSAFAHRDTYDKTGFTLKVGAGTVENGLVTDSFLTQNIAQQSALLLPGQRTYPTLP
jgi:hypothetical protein